jgi:excisionase family DNA binding protein
MSRDCFTTKHSHSENLGAISIHFHRYPLIVLASLSADRIAYSKNPGRLTEFRTCFTHSSPIFNYRAIVVAEMNPDLVRHRTQDRTINEVMIMSKADVYSGTDAVSKRSLIGRSEDVRSHSPKPSSSMSSQDSTSGFEPLFDSVEAARLVRIHPKTVVRMARRGQINGIRVGKLWRFRLSDLQRYVDTHSHTTEVA